jgi:hypothetical protein
VPSDHPLRWLRGMVDPVDFHGDKRSNYTHQSTTDRQARLYKKSKGAAAKLSYLGHALAENRNGLVGRRK